ncbi:MAG: hypothetical protein ACOX9C_10495 [Kiritimatiellia bacterium]|jgi:hypothetical protein
MLGFSVTLPGCAHQNDDGWLEAEVVRETTAGAQHVAWIDLLPDTQAMDQRVKTTELASQNTFSWDGIAQADLPLADHPETFEHGSHPFKLAAPAVEEGRPVPPPCVTLVVRLWTPGKTEVVAEARRKIHVPQVVQVFWEPEAESLFRSPLVCTAPNAPGLSFTSGCGGSSRSAAARRRRCARRPAGC